MNADEMVAKAFLAAFRHHPAGVAILTGDPGDGPVALTISSLISVGVEPPTVAFSLSDSSSSAKALARCETLVVHFVRRTNMQLARLCATSGSVRFGPGVEWDRLATGEPYYPQVETWFRAAIRGKLASPGACLATAELVESSPGWRDAPQSETLVYADRAWHGLRPLADPIRAPLLLWPDDSATF
ncbi:flavin reductase [Mesorhizobium sp. IMUNJ 23232]|uniref:flavin reductase n=1 Tax=Mesorhizobium sp. IMUNJ 23232 TaxID=3376064 RepID=UPI00379090CE